MPTYRLTYTDYLAALEWNGIGLWTCNPGSGPQAGRIDTDDNLNPSHELEADGLLLDAATRAAYTMPSDPRPFGQ